MKKTNVSVKVIGHAKHGRATLKSAIDNAISKHNSPSNTESVEKNVLVVSAIDGPMSETENALKEKRAAGVTEIVVYMNKVDLVDDGEILDIVEKEIKEVLKRHGFNADVTPIIRGSAIGAVAGEQKWVKSVDEVVETLIKD